MPEVKGLVASNDANKTKGRHIHNYSSFDESLSYRLLNTHRFADYSPTFDMEGVESDEVSLNSLDRIDSLSLKAPFKGSIRKTKDSFKVPNMAILPLNWDKIYAQPSNGDDVPSNANCVIANFFSLFKSLWNACMNSVIGLNLSASSTLSDLQTFYTGILRSLVLGEFVYSNGSLLNVSGAKVSGHFFYQRDSAQAPGDIEQLNYDQWFDQCIFNLFEYVSYMLVVEPVGGSTVTHTFRGIDSGSPSGVGRESFRAMLELFRENPLCYVSQVDFGSNSLATQLSSIVPELGQGSSYPTALYNLSLINIAVPQSTIVTTDPTSLPSTTLNLSRLLAYQLVCAHFYTNSNIDFIYSADLYRQYIYVLTRGLFSGSNYSTLMTFSWNGYTIPYDYLSGRLLTAGLGFSANTLYAGGGLASSIISNTGNSLGILAIYSAIFGYRKSLRYGDYFVASRPRALAPINTDVSVNSNLVSVIDITRNIQAQRFANAVMRSRSKIEEYVKSLFGKSPQPDYHNPFFLTSQSEFIYGDEVQNTGDAQINASSGAISANSRTANFAGNLSPHTFTFHNDDMHPCIYLQIVSYDVRVAYSRSIDRQMLHIDRFDMFNPDFQYIGDQPVYGVELGYSVGGSIPATFGYQTRDAEYKQRFDQVSGGFSAGSLPGWCLDDNKLINHLWTSISPDFIRSRNTDLDQLFGSLTGFSLGTYFHFICVTNNNVNAKRAMAVDPQILA